MVVLAREVRTATKRKERTGGRGKKQTTSTVIRIVCPSTHTATRNGLVEFQHPSTMDSSDRVDDLTSATRGCLVRHRGRSQAAPTSPSGSLPCGFTYNHEEGGGGGGIVGGERAGGKREGRTKRREPIAGRRPVEDREEAGEALKEGEWRRKRWERDEEVGGF